MSTTTITHEPTSENGLPSLDTITASLVARQSSSKDGSMSVPDQIDMMTEFCARQNPPWKVGGVYEERDVSGRRPLERRPGLKLAVADVEEKRSQVVLAGYFDRFVRSMATRAEVVQRVEEAGGRVVTMDAGETSDKTAVEWLNGNMLAMMAEFYARQIGEKSVAPKQRNIDAGIPPFPRITPAYQRKDDGTLELHPVGAPIVREAIRMRLDEGASYTKLARWMGEHGIKMTPGGVEALFASRLLVGEIHFGTKFTPNLKGIKEPLIDHATFRRLQSAKAPRGRYAKSDRLLARLGVLVCGSCGARLTVTHSASRSDGKQYAYYRCGNRALCSTPASVACDVAEDYVRDEAIRLGREVVGRASAKKELEAARLERVEAEEALDTAINSLRGLGDRPATKEVLDELQAALDEKVARHERLLAVTTPDKTVRTVADWNRLTVERQRRAIRAVIDRAVVAPGSGPGRITVEGRGELLGE